MAQPRKPSRRPAREPAGERAGQAARLPGGTDADTPRQGRVQTPVRPAAMATPVRGRFARVNRSSAFVAPQTAKSDSNASAAHLNAPNAQEPGRPRRHTVRPISVRVGRKMEADRLELRARSDRRRLSALLVAIVVLFGVLVGRLVNIQVVQGSRWRSAAQHQSIGTHLISAPRGMLLSRDGQALAMDVAGDRVVIDPEQIDNAPYYASQLSSVLGIDEATVLSSMRRERLQSGQMLEYRVLADVDANAAEIIKEMNFPGVSVIAQPRRQMPSKSLAGPVVGDTRPTDGGNEGKSGAEYMFDSILSGRPGELIADHGPNGVEIPRSEKTNRPARAGRDVYLSIDEGIQYQAEQVLLDEVAVQGARGGNVTAMDITNGDILAMANVSGGQTQGGPQISGVNRVNSAVDLGFNPGSTMKLVTISKAIEKRCITADKTFTVPDHYQNGGFPLQDDEPHPVMQWTTRDILTHSSNVGTAMIARQCFTAVQLDEALRSYGFGAPTGLGFPGEATGLLTKPARYGDSGIVSNAIGYSLLASPQQVLNAYVAVARGGVPVRPRLMRENVTADGTKHEAAVTTGNRIVNESTAGSMRNMLENVVNEGTGVCAAVRGFTVAGKTGTVRRGGAASNSSGHYASFVGFAPASAPRIAVMVVIDDPRETYGGKVAAPVFSEVMSNALARMQVPAEADVPGKPTQFSLATQNAQSRKLDCAVQHGARVQAILSAQANDAQSASDPTVLPTTTTAVAAPSPNSPSVPTRSTAPATKPGPTSVPSKAGSHPPTRSTRASRPTTTTSTPKSKPPGTKPTS